MNMTDMKQHDATDENDHKDRTGEHYRKIFKNNDKND